MQFSYCQRPESTFTPQYYSYTDNAKKILPAIGEEFKVEVRPFSEIRIEKYKMDPDFNYDDNQLENEDWITRIKNWINQQLATFRASKTYWTFMDFLYYGLMIIAMILIIRGIIKADKRGLLFGKIKSNDIILNEIEEDINELDFDVLIDAAVRSMDYKLAVRYLFLKSLQQLSLKGIIELRNNKTNYQYLLEIKNNKISNAFRITAARFEWIWYGEIPVDEKSMKSSQNEFNELFELLAS